jgi:thiol-disulfide isomerase/thioredoxin
MFTMFLQLSAPLLSVADYLQNEARSSLQTINGSAVSFKEKQQTLIYFWATWCPDCRDKLRTKLPELNSRRDLQVIAVNTDRGIEKARAYVEKEKVQLIVARDDSRELQKSLQIFSVPSWALVETEGDKIKILQKGAGSEMPVLKN